MSTYSGSPIRPLLEPKQEAPFLKTEEMLSASEVLLTEF